VLSPASGDPPATGAAEPSRETGSIPRSGERARDPGDARARPAEAGRAPSVGFRGWFDLVFCAAGLILFALAAIVYPQIGVRYPTVSPNAVDFVAYWEAARSVLAGRSVFTPQQVSETVGAVLPRSEEHTSELQSLS